MSAINDKWHAGVFRCPACRAGLLSVHGGSLICQMGHCFDIAAKGYVNFVPHQKKTKYTRALFENRRLVYDGGFFRAAAEAITEAVRRSGAKSVLDAGCGEGYFIRFLQDAFHVEAYALDIEKEAVRLAARKADACRWMVADLANIPLCDGSVDALINVLTPANLSEFLRVLRPGGIVVKVVPGEGHLNEIRALMGKSAAANTSEAAAHFSGAFRVVHRQRCVETFRVTQEELARFLRMTPLTFGLTLDLEDALGAAKIEHITVDVDILTGERP